MLALTLGLGVLCAMPAGPAAEGNPLAPGPGPHLLLDDFLVERSTGLTRRVNPPVRDLPGPIVTGREDGCFQPYMTALKEPKSGRFRLWYGVPENASQSHLGYLESEDGIHWIRPHRVLPDPARIQFGVSILDEGPDYPDRERRYRYGWWNDGGLNIAISADGLTWKPLAPGVVLKHNHDINNIYYDPIRRRYAANVSSYTTGPTWSGTRRVTMQSVSDDLVRWTEPWYIVTPDARDEGETQFYCMGGVLARGGLLIGMVRVLRDDLPADPGGTVAGIGYTTLAWSRDGRTWTRDREPFLDRHPAPGAWDHAMAWVDCQLPVGEEVYLYYGGYARGHKVERFTERQIGLVRMKRDRYVAREAGDAPGTLVTLPIILRAKTMTLNLDARDGEARVQVTNLAGKPLPGYTFADCAPLSGDSTAAPVRWKRPLERLKGQPVRLEFRLRRGRLFAFGLQ